MAAGVIEAVDITLASPDYKNGMGANAGCDVIAMINDLAFVTQIQPATIKQVRHLQIKDVRVCKRVAVHPKNIL